MTTLATLVGDVDEFASRHWGRRMLHRRVGSEAEQWLGLDDVDELLGSAARRPELRLVRDGVPTPPERWLRARRLGGRLVEDLADPDRVFAEVVDGATVVLQGLHLTWPPLAERCGRLQAEISHPVQANAYLTPAGAAGLSPHADEHDVIVVHTVGAKTWDVEGAGAVELVAGDVLYLPAGTRHSASAQEELSLHVTIGIPAVTRGAAIRRALDRADAEPGLRLPLPLGFARGDRPSPELAAVMSAALDVAGTVLAGMDGEQLAAVELDRARGRRPSRRESHLASLARLEQLSGVTTVEVRGDRGAELHVGSADDGRTLLRTRDREVLFPAPMDPAVRALVAGGLRRIDELPGLDVDDALVLVRRLVREGVLRICPDDAGGSP